MIYINQSLRQYFVVGLNTDNIQELKLTYTTPSGETGEITDEEFTIVDEETGEYYVDFENNFLDEIGIWTFRAVITDIDDKIFYGTPFQLEITDIETAQYPITKEDIKEILGITDTTQDAAIDRYIPVLIENYKKIRGAPFVVINGIEQIPPGFAIAIAKMYDYEKKNSEDMDSERIGSYSYTKKAGKKMIYPERITRLIPQYVGKII